MRCPYCNTENTDTAKFCNECGRTLADRPRDSLVDVASEMFYKPADSLSSKLPKIEIDGDASAFVPDARPMRGGVDFSGLETLVDSSYVPPAPPSRAGDTVELPKIEDRDDARSKSFIGASSSKEMRKQEKAQRKLDRKLAREEKRRAKEASSDSTGMSASYDGRISRKRAGFISVFVVAVAACAVCAVTYSMELWGGKVVPDVVGQSEANATYALQGKGFTTESLAVKSDEVQGIVLLTDPSTGKRAPEGSKVVLHISTPRTIPTILGLPEERARQLIEQEGFADVRFEYVKTNDEEGIVLSVLPEEGTVGKASTPVVVEISQAFTVPDVVDMPQDDAVEALEAEGYEVNVAWHYDESLEEGLAYATEPVAGTKLNSGSEVTLLVTMRRSSVLVNLTSDYLHSTDTFSIGGVNYLVNSIDDISYEGDDTVSYTLTATRFETYYWFGTEADTRYDSETTSVSGVIEWSSSNEIVSASPSIKRL